MATSLEDLISQISEGNYDALEQLARAVHTAGDLSVLGDLLVDHFVEQARASGASWAQIGQQLGGVSKQAAQQRFTPDFSRFTDRARAVMTGSQAVAEEHQHSYMGTEHLLIALCQDRESLAAKALDAVAGGTDQVHDAAVARLAGPSPVPTKPRFTAKGKAALTSAVREALDLGHNYIGTEHLLLGLMSGPQRDPSVAYEILTGRGVTHQALRDSVTDQLAAITAANK